MVSEEAKKAIMEVINTYYSEYIGK